MRSMPQNLIVHPSAIRSNPTGAITALVCMRIVLQRGLKSVRAHTSENFIELVGDFLAYRPATIEKIIPILIGNGLPDDLTSDALKSKGDAAFAATWLFDENGRDKIGLIQALFALAKRSRAVFRQLMNDSTQHLERHVSISGSLNSSFSSLTYLAQLFGLNEYEKSTLMIAMLRVESRDFADFLSSQHVSNRNEAVAAFASACGSDAKGFAHALHFGSCLYEYGVLSREGGTTDLGDIFTLEDAFSRLLLAPHASMDAMVKSFLLEADPSSLTMADYPHMQTSLTELTRFLEGALATRESGIHVMLYGAPGTGKTEFARMLARFVKCTLYEIGFKDDSGDSTRELERYGFLRVAQQFLACSSGNLILFDEAEDVFPLAENDLFFGHGSWCATGRASGVSKAWLNRFLETNPVPMIWISNEISQIDPANLRRFTYCLEFKAPPKPVRKSIAQRHLAGLRVDPDFADTLSDYPNLVPAQLEAASRFTRLAAPNDEADAQALMLSQLEKSSNAMGNPLPSCRRSCLTAYNADYLNLNAPFTPDQIVAALRKTGTANLCFYGRSGTGKTELGRHIAEQLARTLIIKSASDLLSMWVGGTEKNIRDMFSEAEDGHGSSLLLLDEADTLLRERKHAQQTWEVSQVNEFLHRMENFNGIFICTTNLFDEIDQAMLRRFTFKIEFLPMTTQQRLQMFGAEFSTMAEESIPDGDRRRLCELDGLTPGDFANVKCQVALLGNAFPAKAIIDMLDAKRKARKEASPSRTGMGFLAT